MIKEYLSKGLSCVRERRLPWKIHYRITSLLRELHNFSEYGTFDMFSQVYFDTITTCNRRCHYCPNSKYDRGLMRNMEKMETRLFYKVIDELADINWKGELAPNFFGEPLLDNRLTDLVKYAREKIPESKIILYTNGDFLKAELYKNLIRAGVNVFTITRHPGGAPPFINEIMEYRKINGCNNVELNYQTLKTIYNRGDAEIGEGSNGKGCEDTALRNIGIHWNGDVIFCCNDYFVAVKFGNVKNEKLIDIWKKPYYKQIRKEIRKGCFTLNICKKCKMGTVVSKI